MKGDYLAHKDKVIEELKKQREVQKELMARKAMLAEFIDINNKEFDTITDRLKEIDTKIKLLREKL